MHSRAASRNSSPRVEKMENSGFRRAARRARFANPSRLSSGVREDVEAETHDELMKFAGADHLDQEAGQFASVDTKGRWAP